MFVSWCAANTRLSEDMQMKAKRLGMQVQSVFNKIGKGLSKHKE